MVHLHHHVHIEQRYPNILEGFIDCIGKGELTGHRPDGDDGTRGRVGLVKIGSYGKRVEDCGARGVVLDYGHHIFGGHSVRLAGSGSTDLLRESFDIRDLDVDRGEVSARGVPVSVGARVTDFARSMRLL